MLGTVLELNIGENCWIGRNFEVDGNGTVNIGNNIDIAPNVVINTGGHEIDGVSRRAGKGMVNTVKIEDGCWIGTRVTIINSTKISKGCVVAAGSVIIKDVEENLLVAGVPAVEKKKLV